MKVYILQKKMMKLLFKIFIVLCLAPVFAMESKRGLDGFEFANIDAVKNARLHSNMGNIYFQQENYVSAMKEYEIAYNLTYDLNSSSVYLYNISKCFMKTGKYKLAQKALLGAISKDCMNLVYYDSLVDTYIALNEEDKELKKYLSDGSNPYNRIVAGLIYLKTGQKTNAKIIFDEFVVTNPDMLITNDVKAILKKL